MNDIYEKIKTLDLSSIKNNVTRKRGLSSTDAQKAESLYKQYLTLRAMYPSEVIVPPNLADDMWHEHILNSRQYTEDCNTLFGKYLHHHIDDTDEVTDKGWENSKKLYLSEFGVDLISLRQISSPCR